MTENLPTSSQDTTQQAELTRLLEQIKSSIIPLSQAVRRKLNGHDIDIHAARLDVVRQLDDVVSQVSPSAQQRVLSVSPADLVAGYWSRIAERKDCATTGIAGLNAALSGGLEQDRLMVLLGAPGSGKTTFSNQMADHVAGQRRAVLYVTSEDTPATLLAKTIARRGMVDYNAVLRGWQSHKAMIDAALQEYAASESAHYVRYLDATQGLSLDDMYEQAVSHFSNLERETTGAPLLVVDYLQRLSRHENLGADARQSATVYVERLRAMACDLHCTTLVLSAMNRASGYAGNGLTAAKESGDIEYTADVIMSLAGDPDGLEIAPGHRQWMLRIDKNRQGATTYDQNHINLDWFAARQHFTEVSREDDYSYSSAPAQNGRKGRR